MVMWGEDSLSASTPEMESVLAEMRMDDYQSMPYTLSYGAAQSLAGTTVTRAVDTGAASPNQAQRSILGLPFKFNPPLHRYAQPVRLDFTQAPRSGSSNTDTYLRDDYFDERALSNSANTVAALKGLRLGRIVQHEMAAGMAALNAYRYGFRFLYNPTSITISSSRNDSMILDPQSAVNAVVSGIDQNFQVISFRLLLYRQPDVMSGSVTTSDYMPGISADDLANLRKYGTHYDLEILYRVCNGVFDLEDRGRTSDIGFIVPSNARLLLGGQNHFGFVQSISYNDIRFSRDMVPVFTEVDIVFRRHVDMAAGELSSIFDQSGNNVAGTYTPVTPELTLNTSKYTGGMVGSLLTGGIFGGLVNAADWLVNAADWVGEKAGDIVDPFLPGDQGKPNVDKTVGNNNDAPVPGWNLVTTGWHYSSGAPHGAWDYGKSKSMYGTPVHATRAGTVVRVKELESSYGHHIVLKTDNIFHYYAHLSSFAPGIAVGKTVAAGQHLGNVGSTGNSSGPHLHYEERENDKQYSRHPQWGVTLPGSKS